MNRRAFMIQPYPALVLPTHWDNFLVPYGASQQPARRPAILLTGDRGRFTESNGDGAKIFRSDPSRNPCEVST